MELIWLWIESYQKEFILGMAALLFLLCLFLLLQGRKLRRMEKRMKAYESGSLNKTLEERAAELQEELQALTKEVESEKRRLTRFLAKEKKAIKKVKLIKYNAFETQGGKVSYALALLNEENSGILINSIHSTDFSFSYAKEVVRGEVDQVLSKEEKEVLEKAITERDKLSAGIKK